MRNLIFKARRARLLILEQRPITDDTYTIKPFLKHKCIFIHIPKAAGVSVSRGLFSSLAGGHRTYQLYQSLFSQDELDRFFVFSFVREPIGRLYSAYNFLKQGGFNETDKQWATKYLGHITSFDEFVLEWLNEETMYSYVHFKPQVYFLKNHNGVIDMDFLGRFENLQSDFKVVANQLGMASKALSRENITPKDRGSKTPNFTTEVVSKIEMLYAEDFKKLGYN